MPEPRSTSLLKRPACVALAVLICVGCGGGGSDSVTPDETPNPDSTTAVVGPAGAVVTVPSGVAGVEIPPGLFSQPITITVSQIDPPNSPGVGPLPTGLKQYPPFYEFVTSPPGVALGAGVRVGVCQVSNPSNPFYPPEATHARLRLAHTVGSTIEILEPVDVSDFLKCGTVGPGGTRVTNNLLASFAHGGLGGKVKSFSPFGGVDPGPTNAATVFPISPRAGFILSETNDTGAEPARIIDLSQLGFVPGDLIRLERLGDFKFSPTTAEDGVAMIAVFSSTNVLLDRTLRFRVPGAIASTASPFVTLPTLKNGLDTDIPEDFIVGNITLMIPQNARYLFVGVPDPFFGDNIDSDGNFAIRVSPGS